MIQQPESATPRFPVQCGLLGRAAATCTTATISTMQIPLACLQVSTPFPCPVKPLYKHRREPGHLGMGATLCFIGCSTSGKACITTIIFMAYLPAIFQSHWKFWESITLPNPTASPKCHIPTAIPYTTSRSLISTAFAMFKAALLLLAGSFARCVYIIGT